MSDPLVGVCVFIPVHGGGWVAIRNAQGKYELPGGKVEAGELPMQAAMRETMEEVGLPIGSLTPIYTGDHVGRNGEPYKAHAYYAQHIMLAVHTVENLTDERGNPCVVCTEADLTGPTGQFPDYVQAALTARRDAYRKGCPLGRSLS